MAWEWQEVSDEEFEANMRRAHVPEHLIQRDREKRDELKRQQEGGLLGNSLDLKKPSDGDA